MRSSMRYMLTENNIRAPVVRRESAMWRIGPCLWRLSTPRLVHESAVLIKSVHLVASIAVAQVPTRKAALMVNPLGAGASAAVCHVKGARTTPNSNPNKQARLCHPLDAHVLGVGGSCKPGRTVHVGVLPEKAVDLPDDVPIERRFSELLVVVRVVEELIPVGALGHNFEAVRGAGAERGAASSHELAASTVRVPPDQAVLVRLPVILISQVDVVVLVRDKAVAVDQRRASRSLQQVRHVLIAELSTAPDYRVVVSYRFSRTLRIRSVEVIRNRVGIAAFPSIVVPLKAADVVAAVASSHHLTVLCAVLFRDGEWESWALQGRRRQAEVLFTSESSFESAEGRAAVIGALSCADTLHVAAAAERSSVCS